MSTATAVITPQPPSSSPAPSAATKPEVEALKADLAEDQNNEQSSPVNDDLEEEEESNLTSSSPPSSPAQSVKTVQPGVLSAGAHALTMAAARQIMFDNYTPWVMGTYGDSAKTKTITTRKYARIVNLLKSIEQHNKDGGGSAEPSGSEVAKFRLWVKSKGFHLGPPAGHNDFGRPDATEMLYLPTGTDKVSLLTIQLEGEGEEDYGLGSLLESDDVDDD